MTYQNKGDGGFLYLYLFAYVHPIKTYSGNILSTASVKSTLQQLTNISVVLHFI